MEKRQEGLPAQLDRALRVDQLVLWGQPGRAAPWNQLPPGFLSARVRQLIQHARHCLDRQRDLPLLEYLSPRVLHSPREYLPFRNYQDFLAAHVIQPVQFVPECPELRA